MLSKILLRPQHQKLSILQAETEVKYETMKTLKLLLALKLYQFKFLTRQCFQHFLLVKLAEIALTHFMKRKLTQYLNLQIVLSIRKQISGPSWTSLFLFLVMS